MAVDRRLGILRLAGLSLCVLAYWGVATCAQPGADAPTVQEKHYACANGVRFSARFAGDDVQIVTRSHSYDLGRRPSSIGIRYGSDDVAFIQDEERAVLVGAADGPYRGCIEAGARPDTM